MAAAITPEDLYNFRWIDHVRVSPDGENVAYQVGWADAAARQNRSRIVLRRLLDQAPVDATGGTQRDHSPEWSPDGARLAFVSRVGPVDQVFVVDLAAGGPARQVSSVEEGAGHPAWSPDGSRVAFLGTVLADVEGVVDDPRPPEGKDQVRRAPVARVVRRLDYKHDGAGFVDGRHHHLFVTDPSGADTRQLTRGAWDVTGFDWSPDGSRIVLSGNAEPNSDLQRELNLYLVDLLGNRQRLGGGFELSSPIWSPRGDLIAFVAPNGLDVGLIERLWVVPLAGGGPRCLTTNLDLGVGDGVITDMRAGHDSRVRWSDEGDRIYFVASGPGVTGVWSVDLDGNTRLEVGGRRRVYDFDVAKDAIAFCASDPSNPGELHVTTNGAEARLTDLNPWLRDRYVALPEHHYFTAPDGWKLEGWVLKPEGFDSQRLHPAVMEIHGGPHGQYGWAFFHELQILAGMGYVVFYMNPRGSDGYGERFRREVVRDWGGKDYADLMASLDQLIEKSGCIDTSRMGVGGGSYGGYMTNWIVGQTDRFAAAVAMRSISNLVSEYAQHDIVLWGALELGPPPWPDLDELWRRSPMRYVQNVKTPLLLTAGEMDLRCAISQSEEMFGALRLLGKTVELVRFPEESHDLSRNGRPDRRVERLRRIAGWYERFLGTDSVARVSEEVTQILPKPADAPHEWAKTVAVGSAAAVAAEPAVAEPAPAEAEPEVIQPQVPEATSTLAQIVEPEALPDLPVPSKDGEAFVPEMTTEAYPVLPLAPDEPAAAEEAVEEEASEVEAPPELVAHEPLAELPMHAGGAVAEAELDLQAEAVELQPGLEQETVPEREPAAEAAPEPEPPALEEPVAQAAEPVVAEVEVREEEAAPVEATAESPTVESPTVESPTVESPTVESPTAEVPVVESVAAAAVAEEPPLQPLFGADAAAMLAEAEAEAERVAPVAAVTTAQPEPVPEPVAAREPEPAPVAEAEPAVEAARAPVEEASVEQEAVAEAFGEPLAVALAPEQDAPAEAPPEPVPASAHELEPDQPVAEPAGTSAEPAAPAPAAAPVDVRSTMVAWPTATPASGNGAGSDGVDEATSVIPAWHHPDPNASKRTVSLQALPPEEVATGGGYSALLTFESGPFAGRVVALPDQMVTIGRAPDNDVVIGDPATSGHHGRIEVRSGAFWISDLGSTNGTLVNGEPVIEKELTEGDMISIGQSAIRFTLEA